MLEMFSNDHQGREFRGFPVIEKDSIILPGDIWWEKQHSCRRHMCRSPWPWRLRKRSGMTSLEDSLEVHKKLKKSGRSNDVKVGATWLLPSTLTFEPQSYLFVLQTFFSTIYGSRNSWRRILSAIDCCILAILVLWLWLDMKYLKVWKVEMKDYAM